MPIPDVQSGTDERRLAIDQVGIKGLKFPLTLPIAMACAQPTIAICNVYVALPDDRKGTHMSRLVMLLEERAGPAPPPLSVASLRALLDDLRRAPRRAGRTHRARVPVLRAQDRAGLGRREPARLRGAAGRRSSRDGRYSATVAVVGAGDVAVPVLEGNLRLRRAQPALARSPSRCERVAPVFVDRTGAHRRGGGFVRALWPAEARRREVRHRARLRQPALRRGPGARRRAAARPPTRASAATASRPRTSSRSTTIRRTRASRAACRPSWRRSSRRVAVHPARRHSSAHGGRPGRSQLSVAVARVPARAYNARPPAIPGASHAPPR